MATTDEAKRAHADQMVAAAIQKRQQREAGYREQALKLFPWVCGRCARIHACQRTAIDRASPRSQPSQQSAGW